MKRTHLLTALVLAGLAQPALATNGMFSHGYGMKAKGMAGAATTNTEDGFVGANNPAASAFGSDRTDLGVDLFSPIREATATTAAPIPGGALPPFPPIVTVSDKSDSNYFLIPEFGYTRTLNQDVRWGVTVYGQGGMNTDYSNNLFAGLGASGALGVDLTQLIVAPSMSYKVAPDHAFGVAPLIGYQRFKANGFPNGAGGTQPSPGYDDAFGYGLRVGYFGKLTPTVSVGAAYSTKINFQKFSKYNTFFLDNGDLDLPKNWNVGLGWQAMPELRLALDYQRIDYSGVNSIGAAVPAGGFGWESIGVWKLGSEFKLNQSWLLRAGYSHTKSPITGSDPGDVTGNIVAPGVIKDHVTLGFTYTLASGDELTMAYMHAFKNDVTGASAFNFQTATMDTIQMYQNSLGIQYSWK